MSRLVTRAVVIVLSAVAVAVGAAAAHGTTDPTARRTIVIGRSVDGHLITATELGDVDAPRTTLVVGCIHGNERAGIPIADLLARSTPPAEAHFWIVRVLNPDGALADTRGNARGVDLNRNFPWRWTRLSGVFDSGPHALSEPESRASYAFIERIRPAVSVWFHQHLDVVDTSTGSVRIEQRFARVAGLPTASLTREPGSAVSWETHRFPRATSFVVELPAGTPSAQQARRYVRALDAIAH